jgi:hypothetical protein
MSVKRFVGASARECLRRVKEELGPDAVVISNKPLGNGVEVVAMTPDSLDAISQQAAARPDRFGPCPRVPGSPVRPDDDYTVTLSSALRKAPAVRPWTPYAGAPPLGARRRSPASRPAPLPPRAAEEADVLVFAPGCGFPAAAAEAAAPAAGEATPEVAQLRDEMRVIKSLLERQLAGFAWGEMARDTPTRALLLGEMIEAGFSGQLARKLVQDMPEDMAPDDGRKWLKAAVNRRLRTLPTEADFIDRGGVYAIVGPTGVGKTTTTAKAGGALRGALRRRPAGAADHRRLPHRRPGTVAHLRPHPRRAGVRGARRRGPAPHPGRSARQAHGADRHGRHEPARPHGGRAGGDADALRRSQSPAAAQCRLPRRYLGRRGARLCRRGPGRLHHDQGRRSHRAGAGPRLHRAPRPDPQLRGQRPARARGPAPAQPQLPAAPRLQDRRGESAHSLRDEEVSLAMAQSSSTVAGASFA